MSIDFSFFDNKISKEDLQMCDSQIALIGFAVTMRKWQGNITL